jgi:hypothetical protein
VLIEYRTFRWCENRRGEDISAGSGWLNLENPWKKYEDRANEVGVQILCPPLIDVYSWTSGSKPQNAVSSKEN